MTTGNGAVGGSAADGGGGLTGGTVEGHAEGTGDPVLVQGVLRLEQLEALDPVVRAFEPLADALVANRTVRELLHGKPLGHAAHPLLTDLPIGAWTSAAVLDLTGGSESAARTLVGFGVLTAVPTAVTGWAEWSTLAPETKRVGVVHANWNVVALSLYAASWLARRRGSHGAGVALGLAGGLAVTAGGFLGAHLAIGRRVSTHHPAFDDEPPLAAVS